MLGESDLSELLRNMRPVLNSGEYVFATVKEMSEISREDTVCEFKEVEGTTLVLEREKAESLGLEFNYVAAWITLKVHSSLNAVGLTAAFSNGLALHGISCNVIAGYFHDHIFVDSADANKAIEVLNDLAKG